MRRRTNGVEIPVEELRRIILKHVAADEGLDVADFLTNSELHFHNANDKDSDLDSVVIAWDGGRRG